MGVFAIHRKKRGAQALRKPLSSLTRIPVGALQRAATRQILHGNRAVGIQRQDQQPASPCSGYESDPQSFAWVVARHYIQTVLGRRFSSAEKIDCTGNGKLCFVEVDPDIRVAVSFARVPSHVIARGVPPSSGPRREFTYTCSPDGRVTLQPRTP